MKPAPTDPATVKQLVQQSYDRCSGAYSAARRQDPGSELALVSNALPDGARVLDIGCGAGVPVARALAERFVVTGVDISGEQIARARVNIPQATFFHSDIMSLSFPDNHFHAIVSFYAIFHLPREEHAELIRRIASWLAPGGYLLATVSQEAERAYTEDDFFDVTMYWSNYGLADYQAMVEKNGLRLLQTDIIGHGYGEQPESTERHPLIFAQKV